MRGSRLFFLAESYQQRFQRKDTKADLEMALEMLPRAFENPHAPMDSNFSGNLPRLLSYGDCGYTDRIQACY